MLLCAGHTIASFLPETKLIDNRYATSLIPCLTRLDIAGQYVTVGRGTYIRRAFVLWFKCILSFLVCFVAKMIAGRRLWLEKLE